MPPFEPVVVDEAREDVVPEISVEARIVLVGIAEPLPHRRQRVGCSRRVDQATKVGSLPAHDRSAAFDYYTTADASCTLNS